MTVASSKDYLDFILDGIIEPVAGHGKGKYRFKNRKD